MVDLTRDAHGQVRARLLDLVLVLVLVLVLGRSAPAYARWLDARQPTFRPEIKHAALDPFCGYVNALRDSLPDAVQVLDAFHVVKLGTQVLYEVRRRVQQEQLDRRGHRDDPLYKIRGLLRHGLEHLERTPTRTPRRRPGWRRPARRSRARLVLLPAAPRHLRRHRQPAGAPAAGRGGHRQLPDLPDTRGCPARPRPARLAGPKCSPTSPPTG